MTSTLHWKKGSCQGLIGNKEDMKLGLRLHISGFSNFLSNTVKPRFYETIGQQQNQNLNRYIKQSWDTLLSKFLTFKGKFEI